MKKIELLAPARNLECGIAAIDHGADAVYIGAERFGARAAACNAVGDIEALCRHAHVYGAKVYVTVNTIVYDDELEATHRLLGQLAEAGVDAFLVQDMGIVGLAGKVALHASTQTDNRTAEKVRWLRDQGFSRVVLARELSLEEIRLIHEEVPDVELEVFVHGALCVSYSGVCYASQYCFGRSANRGACAQFCRLKFDLQDADGHLLERGRHLLSLKDLCQIDALEQLMEAGAVSFKIEGRLKDVFYVKNVVAAYSQRLNEIVARHSDRYCRASKGRCTYSFTPNLKKTFNRGFTHYFLNGRQPDIASFDTPKAVGEFVGRVKEVRGDSFSVAGTARFANGDGLCFFSPSAEHRTELEGFRVNKVVNNRLFPQKMPTRLRPGMALYRNNDQEFERLLSRPSSERRVEVDMSLDVCGQGFVLRMSDTAGVEISCVSVPFEHQQAQKPQADNIRLQLSKLGNTPFVCRRVNILHEADQFFLPSSVLSALRRKAVEARGEVSVVGSASGAMMALSDRDSFAGSRRDARLVARSSGTSGESSEANAFVLPREYRRYPYLMNVSNRLARKFYERQGVRDVESAFELRHGGQPGHGSLLMQCRHCIRYSLGRCLRRDAKASQWREPLSLVLADGRHFRLQFDCQQCQMNVYAE